MPELNVLNQKITHIKINEEDYISITDRLKSKDRDFFVSDRLRNRKTIEFLGICEEIHNPNFNYGEFAIIKSQADLYSYKISISPKFKLLLIKEFERVKAEEQKQIGWNAKRELS